jgi:hypothetical protein
LSFKVFLAELFHSQSSAYDGNFVNKIIFCVHIMEIESIDEIRKWKISRFYNGFE